MLLHPTWWRVLLDEAQLIPVPLDERGLPDPAAHPIPSRGMDDAWLVIAPASARLSPDFAAVLRSSARQCPEAGIFYADEIEDAGSLASRPQLKPALDVALLLADDYVGSPLIVRLGVFRRLHGLRAAAGTAMVNDFVLRAVRAGTRIERIARIMVAHNSRRPRATIEDRLAVCNDWIRAASDALEVAPGITPESLQLRRRFAEFPAVTLVVPTRQALQEHASGPSFGLPHVVNLLGSIVDTDWPMERITVMIGDDVPDELIYSGRQYPFALRRIDTRRDPGDVFNYAAKMNRMWRESATEHLVLMNDDVVVRGGGWLRALMTFAMEEEVGGVGARLLFADGKLQHAGIPGGLCGGCAHAWMYEPAADRTYNDWALLQKEWSMVTGAVFATRRSVLERVNGFDERFALEFNDVDLCLRMRMLGYRIVFTPFAELLHYEKASRGNTRPQGAQVALFMKRWGELLDNDPAFNPGFDMTKVKLKPVAVADAWYAAPGS
jgi:glycosyl transferase family 2